MMKGIMRKQAFVFGLPLAIGLLHSVFAMKAASFFSSQTSCCRHLQPWEYMY
nr:hypothetical protein [Planococcus glaciei]